MPWFSHCFATIDNFCLGFLQWLNKTKKNDKTQLSAITPPPWGVQSCFFALLFVFLDFWFFGFLVFWFLFSGSLLVFLQWLNKTKIKKNEKPTKQKKMTRPNSLPLLPPGVCNLVFLFCFGFFFVFFGFLVFCNG